MKKIQNSLIIAGIFLLMGSFVLPSMTLAASLPNTSENWSGYVSGGGTFTGVTGTWTIPEATLTNGSGNLQADAAWVGIGGVTGQDLIQVGTQQIVSALNPVQSANNSADTNSGGSSVQYQAWFETLPSAESIVPLTISAGNSITASITQTYSNIWQITIVDNTTGQQYQTSVNYQSSLSSAEWVEEMPTGNVGAGNDFIPLDNFGTMAFSNAYATENGSRVSLSQSGAQMMTMTNQSGVALAVPSAVGGDGASFTVSRTSAQASNNNNVGGNGSGFSRRTWRRVGVGVQGYVSRQGETQTSTSSSFQGVSSGASPFRVFRFFRNNIQTNLQGGYRVTVSF